jgi:hypothetical protein
MKSFRPYVINAATAAAISLAAITSGAAPVAAGSDDMRDVLAGIAAVAVFVGLLNPQEQQQSHGTVSRARPLSAQPAWQALDPGWQDGRPPRDALHHDRAQTRGGPRLPAVCALEPGNLSGAAVHYAEPCLRHEGVAYGLPQFCARQVHTRHFQGRAFEAGCLRDAGYRTETRH